MRNRFRALPLFLLFAIGVVAASVPPAEAARTRSQQKMKRIPVPTPRPQRELVLPAKGPVPMARPRLASDGGGAGRDGVVSSAKGDRVFRTLPAATAGGHDRDDRAGAFATPGADLPPAISTDLDAVNPQTLAPGTRVPSLAGAFQRALQRDPRRCTDDIRALRTRRTAAAASTRHDIEDYIRAGVRAGASESQMRQTLAAFAANKSALKNQRNLAIIDYADRSNQKRLFILDLQTNTVKSYFVAHGKGSDPNGRGRATKFGNVPNSKRSSLGCFVAGGTYSGENGRSLILHGLEPGVNDNACARSVVMHGADYVGGMPGRSWGCPAVRHRDRKEVFDKLGGGGLICAFNGDDRG